MRLLITGGLGFIGRACIARLLDRGCREIHVLDNLDTSVHGAEPDLAAYTADWDERVTVTIGSVTDQALLARLVHDVDTVLHLASLTSVPGSTQNTAQYCDVNVVGTANLVGLLANTASVRRLILVSSRAVYGEGPYRCPSGCVEITDTTVWRAPSDLAAARWDPVCPTCGGPLEALAASEDAALQPTSVYGLTKLAQEHLVRTAVSADRMDVAVFRLQNVYGVGQSRATPDVGVANILAEHALGGATLQLFEDGQVTRDFVYIDDVADLLVQAAMEDFTPGRLDTFNVGTGVATSLRGLADAIFAAAGQPPKIVVSGEYRVGDVRHSVADMTRLAAVYPWSPVPLRAGLDKLVDWLRRR